MVYLTFLCQIFSTVFLQAKKSQGDMKIVRLFFWGGGGGGGGGGAKLQAQIVLITLPVLRLLSCKAQVCRYF